MDRTSLSRLLESRFFHSNGRPSAVAFPLTTPTVQAAAILVRINRNRMVIIIGEVIDLVMFIMSFKIFLMANVQIVLLLVKIVSLSSVEGQFLLLLQRFNDERQRPVKTVIHAAMVIGKFLINMVNAIMLKFSMHLPGTIRQMILIHASAVDVQ